MQPTAASLHMMRLDLHHFENRQKIGLFRGNELVSGSIRSHHRTIHVGLNAPIIIVAVFGLNTREITREKIMTKSASTITRKLRVQPTELVIPSEDPFKHDLLERKESVEILTNLLRNIQSPCVLSIDAEWGNGKTTFLKIWAQFLRNNKFKVVEFNAWETDFSNDPFEALTAELRDGIRNHTSDTNSSKSFIKSAKNLMRISLPIITRLALYRYLGRDSVQEIVNADPTNLVEKIGIFESNQNVVDEFKSSLQTLLEDLPTTNDQLPLVVMIDELDRCRPSYAIELLEVTKHLFSVDGMVFVLALNHSQLIESTKALYGIDFDANEYLKRFFDIDFRLHSPPRESLIKNLIESTTINDIFSNRNDNYAAQYSVVLPKLLCGFFKNSNLSHRQVAKSIHRLSLVLGSLDEDMMLYFFAVVVLVLRSIDSDKLHEFCRGELADSEYSNYIFKCAGASTVRQQMEGAYFEAVIVIGKFEISGIEISKWQSNRSELWTNYKKNILDENEGRYSQSSEVSKYSKYFEYALREIILIIESDDTGKLSFLSAVERVEFIAQNLTRE